MRYATTSNCTSKERSIARTKYWCCTICPRLICAPARCSGPRRWSAGNTRREGCYCPSAFIGVAESVNLAGKLGRLVMRSACAEFSRWRSHRVGRDAVLRINVSPVQLISENFVGTVADHPRRVRSQRQPPLYLEITESVLVQDIEATRKRLAGLKDVGVQIAIDDFGTGYSMLTNLKTLPLDTIKIDIGFVRELGTSTSDLAMVQGIVGLADAFDLNVVAEGVETAAAARTLLGLGCYRAQGFLLSPPLVGAAMQSLLARRFIPVDFSA